MINADEELIIDVRQRHRTLWSSTWIDSYNTCNDVTMRSSLLKHPLSTTKLHSTKLCLPLSTINWSLPSAISKDQTSVFSTCPPHWTLHRLSFRFGFSRLSSRSFFVKASTNSLQLLPLSFGVPQGPVLGPLVFIQYTTPLRNLIDHHFMLKTLNSIHPSALALSLHVPESHN